MSKYQPLSERLSGRPDDEWRASFAEIEQVLGFPLPKAARSGTAWWSNNADKAHARAWTAAGWEVAEVDQPSQTVTFRRPVSEAELQNPLVEELPEPEVIVVPEAAPTASPLMVTEAPHPASPRRWGLAAAVAGGVAVAAGLGALAMRLRRR